MELLKCNVERNGNEYKDLWLSWEYQGKTYFVRVRPVFARDYDKLFSSASPLLDTTKLYPIKF